MKYLINKDNIQTLGNNKMSFALVCDKKKNLWDIIGTTKDIDKLLSSKTSIKAMFEDDLNQAYQRNYQYIRVSYNKYYDSYIQLQWFGKKIYTSPRDLYLKNYDTRMTLCYEVDVKTLNAIERFISKA